jgi:hypothetical protein
MVLFLVSFSKGKLNWQLIRMELCEQFAEKPNALCWKCCSVLSFGVALSVF